VQCILHQIFHLLPIDFLFRKVQLEVKKHSRMLLLDLVEGIWHREDRAIELVIALFLIDGPSWSESHYYAFASWLLLSLRNAFFLHC
jgi:hypothetical protein